MKYETKTKEEIGYEEMKQEEYAELEVKLHRLNNFVKFMPCDWDELNHQWVFNHDTTLVAICKICLTKKDTGIEVSA
jgi:hypothetical protein